MEGEKHSVYDLDGSISVGVIEIEIVSHRVFAYVSGSLGWL